MVQPTESQNKEQKSQLLKKPYFSPALTWALIFSILGFNFFLYETHFGLDLGLFFSTLVISTFLILDKTKKNIFSFVLVLIGILSNLLIAFRANGFVQAMNLLTGLACLTLLFITQAQERIRFKTWWLIKKLFELPFQALNNLPLLSANMNQSKQKRKNKIPGIIKTTMITFLLLLFFSSILSAADPIFSQIINKIRGEALSRTILSLILALVLTPLFTLQARDQKEKSPKLKFLSFQDTFIPAISLVGLFAFFLAIQLKYLFASHEVFQSFDLTYSEYVRKGFFELILASLLGGFLAYMIILKKNVLEKRNLKNKLKFVNLVLMLELFLLLASAFKRNLMYIEVYGLTRTRIIGEIFLFWVTSTLLSLTALNIFKPFKEKHFLTGIAITSLIVLAFLNAVNMDQIIVKTIPNRHQQKTDLFYIAILSEDAFAGWQKAIPQAQKIFDNLKEKKTLSDEEKSQLANVKLAMLSLQQKRDRLIKKYGHNLPQGLQKSRKWRSKNYAEYQAFLGMLKDQSLFEDNLNQLVKDIKEYQQQHFINLYKQEKWILYEFEYPFITIGLDYRPIDESRK